MSKEDEFIQKHLALIKEKTKMIKEETGEYFPYGKEWQKEMMKFPKPALIMMLAGEFQKVKQYEKEAQQFKQSSPIGVAEQIAADEIMHLFELSLYEESGYIVTKGKIIEILKGIAGSQWASPRWVKANERLPEITGTNIDLRPVKYEGVPYVGRYVIEEGLFKNCFIIAMLTTDAGYHLDKIEWLDETPARPTAVNGVQPKAVAPKAVKSKEEIKLPYDILQDHVDPHCFLKDKCVEAVIDAMEEYANQFKG